VVKIIKSDDSQDEEPLEMEYDCIDKDLID